MTNTPHPSRHGFDPPSAGRPPPARRHGRVHGRKGTGVIRSRIKGLAVGVLSAGVVLGTGVSSASARPVHNERFWIVTLGSAPGTVLAQGSVNAIGTSTNNRRQLPPGTPFDETFSFPQGNIYTKVSAAGPPQVHSDPTTCITQVTAPDRFVVTGGTGTFAHVEGSGTGTAHVTIVAGRNPDGSCSNGTPIFELTVTEAKGTVNLAA